MKNHYRLAFASVMGVILSYTLVFLAALPMRYLRLNFGRKVFIASTVAGFALLCSFQLWQWSARYLSLCFLIGTYRELEERNYSVFMSSAVSVLLTAGANILFLFSYTKFSGEGLRLLLTEKAAPLYEQFKNMPQFKNMDLEQLIWFLPSGLVITFMIVVFVSLTVARVPRTIKDIAQLRQFRLPDEVIWIFLASLACSILDFGYPLLQVAGTNVLFVAVAAYFFQGLAVFTYFLDRLRVFGLWRVLAYFLACFHLIPLISGLGILDYWFDFRTIENKEIKNNKLNIS